VSTHLRLSINRQSVNQSSAILFGPDYPYGTLFVNIFGPPAMGLSAGWFPRRGEGEELWGLFLAKGVLVANHS
jgi:fluoride ion exporter CrcB/FEX